MGQGIHFSALVCCQTLNAQQMLSELKMEKKKKKSSLLLLHSSFGVSTVTKAITKFSFL